MAWHSVHCRVLSSLASPSHREPRRSGCYQPLPNRRVWPLDAHRRGAGHPHPPGNCIGTRRASMHWHTPHPTPTPLRAWGAQRGDCERLRPCIAPTRDRAPPPFPGHPSSCAAVDAKLLFESQAERSRPWFAQVPASVRDLAFSLQSYAAAGIRRAEVRLSMHCSQSAARRPACSAAHGDGAGGHWSVPHHLAQHTFVHASPAPGHKTPAHGPDLWWTTGRGSPQGLRPPSPLSDGAHFGDFVSILRESAVCLRGAASRH